MLLEIFSHSTSLIVLLLLVLGINFAVKAIRQSEKKKVLK